MTGEQQNPASPAITGTDLVIREVAEMLAIRHYPSHIKEHLESELGIKITGDTFSHLCTKARILLRSRRDVDLNESFDQAIEFYASILRDKSVDERSRIKCQERLDLLLGHERAGEGLSLQDKAERAIEILQDKDNDEVLSNDTNEEMDEA